jgi:hypothetical protein
MVTYDNCVSSEGQGLLTPIMTFAQQIKRLKTDPDSQILVASIQGPVTPYTVHWTAAPTTDTGPWPSIEHSCDGGTASGFADPGVRMQQFVTQFRGNGSTFNICDTDYTASLNTIATKLSALIGPKCIAGTIANKSATSATPDCTVTDVLPDGKGGTIQTVLPACADNGGVAPCWDLQVGTGPLPAGNGCPANQHVLTPMRTGTPPDNLKSAVECSICVAGSPNPLPGC